MKKKTKIASAISAETVKRIIARGYVVNDETKEVFRPANYSKLTISRPDAGPASETIWVVKLTDEAYIFANQALIFFPNYSWGALCFVTEGKFDFSKTEANLKRIYKEYITAYMAAQNEEAKKPAKKPAKKSSK